MLVIDLQWFVFGLLLIVVAALAAGPWVRRQLRHLTARGTEPGWAGIGPGLEHAPCGLLVLRGGRACHYANPYARRLLGLSGSRCQLPDAPWVHLLDADRAAMRGEPGASRYRHVALPAGVAANPDKQIIRWWVTAMGEADLVFLLDVTNQQRAEEAARSLVNDLSHELRTPLATILTHLEVLSLPDVPAGTGSQSVSLLKAEARRMARLVHQMLELGRLETSSEIERRPLDLVGLAEEALAQVAPLATERGITLSLSADTSLPLALATATGGDRDFATGVNTPTSNPGRRIG